MKRHRSSRDDPYPFRSLDSWQRRFIRALSEARLLRDAQEVARVRNWQLRRWMEEPAFHYAVALALEPRHDRDQMRTRLARLYLSEPIEQVCNVRHPRPPQRRPSGWERQRDEQLLEKITAELKREFAEEDLLESQMDTDEREFEEEFFHE
jgi:hypothetical protein